MPFAHLDDIDIWYEISSPQRPDAPLLALTHGFASTYWPPVVDEFRARFRVLEYHVRGHGRSGDPGDPSQYSVRRFSADLAGLLDALDIERAHVGGVSMGGIISAAFACDYPSPLR